MTAVALLELAAASPYAVYLLPAAAILGPFVAAALLFGGERRP